ncbi:GtrA family protein [Neolewinella aurantiaca]|uniref:GtrA family protein n=2 Tax=Neolewinella aurantiaca TaxID=2602767 RepID=A0A5C7FY45_9BACT|nr:GtrA family protein [Neolewinella aurantiaca]
MMKPENYLPESVRKMIPPFVLEKIPFLLSGIVATGINFGMYLLLVDRFLPPGPATMVAYSSSVLVNFVLQRYFVFELRRSVQSAFVLSMLVSAGGMLLDWLIVTGLHQFPYLGDQEWIIKGAATGIVFFYNFYAKRRVFEGARPQDATNVEKQDPPTADSKNKTKNYNS